ncbi:MAG: hydrogenase expression/formation protein [Gammaproteobacteria bacterium]|nr:hydrogenase expression/formation protein [Gammaproteobacteria bacterium]
MTDSYIPVSLTGPGSQPAESEGEALDILQMPSSMETYVAPPLPEPEEVVGLGAGIELLQQLHLNLRRYETGMSGIPLELHSLDRENLELVDQVLGEGEVSIVSSGERGARIQESVLAGVWRIKYLDANGGVQGDTVEVAPVSRLICESAFVGAERCITTDSSGDSSGLPDGVVNAPPLLAEINDKVASCEAGDPAHVINLTLLPQTDQDLPYLAQCLGEGSVKILSRGYGNYRISSTAIRYLWWVQHSNSQDRNILNSLEEVQVPEVACAAPEDIHDNAERLGEILEMYR